MSNEDVYGKYEIVFRDACDTVETIRDMFNNCSCCKCRYSKHARITQAYYVHRVLICCHPAVDGMIVDDYGHRNGQYADIHPRCPLLSRVTRKKRCPDNWELTDADINELEELMAKLVDTVNSINDWRDDE